MNVFEKFSIGRRISIKEGEVRVDQQRLTLFPLNFIGIYTLKIKDNPEQLRALYQSTKKGFAEFSVATEGTFGKSFMDFLKRYLEYANLGGYGIAEWQSVEEGNNKGIISFKNPQVCLYLKSKGMKEPCNHPIRGLLAGGVSTYLKVDLDVIEAKCVCAGDDMCVYYWGPKEYLKQKFPELASKQIGDA